MKRKILHLLLLSCFALPAGAQQVTLTSEQLKALTPDWKGDRSPDGRPRVADKLMERLKKVHLEEAWGILRNRGFQNQFEGDWDIQFPDTVMTGRVVTAQYMPLRP